MVLDYADPLKYLPHFFVHQTIALKVTDVQLDCPFMLNMFLVPLQKPAHFVYLQLDYPFIQATYLCYHEFDDLIVNRYVSYFFEKENSLDSFLINR